MPSRGQRTGAGHRRKPDPLAAKIGRRIRALRQDADFTFDAWVEELGLGRGYVSELERGLVVPRLDTLTRIAKALDVTVADLVAGESPRERLFAATRGLPDEVIETLLSQLPQHE